MEPVIVFGPTGGAGSHVARTASKLNAKVILAMRDTKKPVPGLDESRGSLTRVTADLNDSKSCYEAVKSSGARKAFIYLAHGSKDHMAATIRALKDAGITFVVFLSSGSIPADVPLTDVSPSNLVPYMHSTVEVELEKTFGDNYVAIRPGAFATNMLRWRDQLIQGQVRYYAGDLLQDSVTPDDMGTVAGHVLVQGPKNGQSKVYVYGPQLISVHDTLLQIAKSTGREVSFREHDAAAEMEDLQESGIPPVIAGYLVDVYRKVKEGTSTGGFQPHYDEGVENVQLYTGRPSMPVKEWVEANKGLFSA